MATTSEFSRFYRAHGNLASRIGHPLMKNAARDHLVSLSECQLAMAYIKSATTILGLLKELVTLSSHERLDLFPCATASDVAAHTSGFRKCHPSYERRPLPVANQSFDCRYTSL